MYMTPSSSGWRKTSRTWRRNSGNSSKKSTPLWASDTSPGMGTWPPPISPASERLWWDAYDRRAVVHVVIGLHTFTKRILSRLAASHACGRPARDMPLPRWSWRVAPVPFPTPIGLGVP
jgi:hypothetical protein